jgi:hypothetical protein
MHRLIRQLMRINDIPLDPLPTHYSQSQLPNQQNTTHRLLSSRRPSSANRAAPSTSSNPASATAEAYDQIINKLRKLALGSSSTLLLSLEQLASHLVTDVYEEYSHLLQSNITLITEAYELFKESQFSACLMKLQHGYQVSCVLEFIEREFSELILEKRTETMKKKKTLIQRLEEEREEVRLKLAAGKLEE